MTFTFKQDLTDDISQVRQLIGDTDGTKALFPDDGPISAYLARGHHPTYAASLLAWDLAARFAREVTTANDRMQQVDSDLFKHYTALAQRLEKSVPVVVSPIGAVPDTGPIVTGSREPWSPRDECWGRPWGH